MSLNTLQEVKAAGHDAITVLAAFLRSPMIRERLKSFLDGPALVQEILKAQANEELADSLLTAPDADLETLAHLLVAAVGDKTPKVVDLASFVPKNEFLC